MNIFLLILFGLIAGVFGGMGMGGGTLLIPLLTIFLSFNQKVAQGFNLLSFLLMAVIAIIIHAKNKMIDSSNIFPIILGGVIFSVGGSLLANLVSGKVLRIIFGVFLIVLAIFEFVKVFKENSANN